MQPDDPDAALLWDMVTAARDVVSFTAGVSFQDYLRDRMRQLAVERAIEIIGEAARKLSGNFRDAHPEIAWRKIIAQRHVLAHEYGAIQHERIWDVAVHHVPALAGQLEPFIPPLPPPDEPA